MYELIRFSAHNWNLLEAQDIDIHGITAVIGPTGAGKSTMLDGIQTVLSANNANLLNLNAAAGEQRDRSVIEYCLGCVIDIDHGAPRRDGCETTLALTFRDTELKRNVAIGIMLTAAKGDKKAETRHLFIAPDVDFRIKDFVVRDADGDAVMLSHESIMERLRAACGKRLKTPPNSVKFADAFLAEMRPTLSPDGLRFLRTFSNALAAREIKDPTHFVRTFVLEPQRLPIDRIRERIANWREMEGEARRLEEMLRDIGVVRGRFATWARQHVKLQTERFLAAHTERLRIEREIAGLRVTADKAQAERDAADQLITNHRQAIKALETENADHRATMATTSKHGSLIFIETAETASRRERDGALDEMKKAADLFARAAHLRDIEDRLPLSCHPALAAARGISGLTAGRKPAEWLGRAEDVAEQARAVLPLAKAGASFAAQRDALAAEIAALDGRIAELTPQVEAAGRSDGVMLSRHVKTLMEELLAQGIVSRALPDVVDVAEPEWAYALESLLGPNREALLVDRDQMSEAYEYLYRNRNRFHGCRLVNVRKTRGQGERAVAGSIAGIVRTGDSDARAFIDSLVGHYARAEDEHDLQRHQHAIMRNGKTTSGLALRVHQDLTPLLGRTAQAAALDRARAELDELRAQRRDKQQTKTLLEQAAALVAAFTPERAGAILAAAESARTADAQLRSLATQRASLETEDTRLLSDAIAENARMIKDYGDELKEQEALRDQRNTLLIQTNTQIEIQAGKIEELARRERAIEAEQAAADVQSMIKLAGVEETIERARATVETKLAFDYRGREKAYLAETRIQMERQALDTEKSRVDNQRRAVRELHEFVSKYVGPSPLPENATEIDQFHWCLYKEQKIEEHELRPYRERVIAARAEMEMALKEDLLAQLWEKFELVRTQIDALNARLKSRTFVGQIYSFSRTVAARYKAIHDLAVLVGSSPERGLFGPDAKVTDDEYRQAMERIEAIVSSTDAIDGIEDYRQYFEFELDIKTAGEDAEVAEGPADSGFSKKAGKMSGGQRQAPYYVAIAASMVATYYPKGRTGQGMGLVMFDEAFNKLDIKNTRALIEFYRSLGLQVIIAAPEDKRPTFLECVDSIVSVVRPPSSDALHMDTETIGARARAAMHAENPEYRGPAAFRFTPALAAE